MDQLSEGLRKLILAGIGAVAATKEKSEGILDELVKKGELTVEQGKVLNEELKHNIKDAIRENVTLHVVTPEETCGEENDEEESADDTADFVMDAVDSLNDEQLIWALSTALGTTWPVSFRMSSSSSAPRWSPPRCSSAAR